LEDHPENPMATVIKYCLLQIPGLMLVGIGLFLLHDWGWITGQTACIVLAVWIIKDALLYPVYRPALMGGNDTGGQALVGHTGRVKDALDPRGLVEVAGERWQAVREAETEDIPAGTRVKIIAAHGMVLTVRPVGRETTQ